MAVTRQKYVKDINNNIFSPVTFASNVTQDSELVSYYISNKMKNLIWWSQSDDLTLVNQIPCYIIHVIDGNYGKLDNNRWKCVTSGEYRIDAHVRLDDFGREENGDRSLQINLYDSEMNVISARKFWYNQSYRGTISGSVTFSISEGNFIGLAILDPEANLVPVHNCSLYIYY